ncbi:MAG: LysM peptidoglycan-binding domain-containing protein [Anaerolineae bacterium]
MRRYPRWLLVVLCVTLCLVSVGLISVPIQTARAQTAPAAATSAPVIHTVASGETLARVAQRYGVSLTALLAANPEITNPDRIFVGQQIRIPAGGTVSSTPLPSAATNASGGQSTQPPTQTATPGPSATPTITLTRTLFPTETATPTFTAIPTNTPLPADASGLSATIVPPISASIPFETGGTVYAFSYPERMRAAGMTWARSEIRWNLGDPITAAQGAIEAAHSYGFHSLISVTGSPAQMMGDPSGYYQNFAAYLGEVAALNPEAIEVWSAPNLPANWPGGQINPAAYTQMLRIAYEAIKRANPNVLVISAAPDSAASFAGRCDGSGCDAALYLQAMATAGADQSADCMGMRYTDGALAPGLTTGDPRGGSAPTFIPLFNEYARVFPNKPVCVTQVGYLSFEGFPTSPAGYNWAANTSAEEQAQWIAEAEALAQTSGRARLFIVYNIDSTLYTQNNPQAGWAVVRPDGTCPVCGTP